MKHFLYCLFIFSCLQVKAQKHKVVYGELLGNGYVFISINYDQRLTKAEDGLGFRVGLSIIDPTYGSFTFPFLLNYLVGSGRHQLELGAGLVFLTRQVAFGDIGPSGIPPTFAVMYRLNNMFDSRWNFRVGWTPIFDKLVPQPYHGGISFGVKL